MTTTLHTNFDDFFRDAFDGRDPFDYQNRLATEAALPSLVHVPTGAGKTAAVLGAWLWRRMTKPESIGRRLVYCLPMRTLVEQTRGVAKEAIKSLSLQPRFRVHTLMGGEVDSNWKGKLNWEAEPERECIIIGTQDMLLSRALNRGYAMSRYKWPVHFGLLNNDCLWVFDEIQLMGNGLATSTQLAAFRQQFKVAGQTHSIWMSATLKKDWLETVDWKEQVATLEVISLSEADREAAVLSARLKAVKLLSKANEQCRLPNGLAEFVQAKHQNGTQTLVIVNTVKRARDVFQALTKLYDKTDAPQLELIHSRFRPAERKTWHELFKDESYTQGMGRIIVATQVVEAGVDISSRLLITDLAPFSSLVQRFGRCNRNGEHEQAEIFWIDRPTTKGKIADKAELEESEKQDIARPYDWLELETAQKLVENLDSASPEALEKVPYDEPYQPKHVLRRRDLVDLFDTTPDLSGYDLDISRFVRDSDERDVSVAWRDLQGEKPPRDAPKLLRDELCSVSIGDELRTFLNGKDTGGKPRQAWTWNPLERDWQKVSASDLRAGMTLLLDIRAGGYDERRGWDASSKSPIIDVSDVLAEKNEAYPDDPLTFHPKKYLQTLAAHSREARAAAEQIIAALDSLALDEWRDELLHATHHHDWGKCHEIFQETLHKHLEGVERNVVLAKSTGGGRHSRPHFRHELASALALLQHGASDLAVYLAACHHGKVRLSIRALPGESKPQDDAGKLLDSKFARGIWDGDNLPAVELGDGVREAETLLDLEPMLMGASENGALSWLERMIALRDELGVFRLAFLESLIRAADVRASANPQEVL